MSTQNDTVVVRGLAPLIHDFSRLSRDASRALRDRLRLIAEPVALDVKFRDERFGARTVSGVKVAVRQRGVAVEQTLRKSPNVSRQRRNFGGLQMTEAFEPALADNIEAINAGLDAFLDELVMPGSLL